MFIRTTLACVLLLATVATVTPASIRAGDGRKTGSSISASLLACDEQTCNGLRTCRSGKCECRDATMTGESCDTPKFKCLNGVRDTNGKCQCDSGYKGSLCEDFDCPNNCSSTPTKSFANGCEISDAGVHSCVCKDGYTGQDCHNRVCAVGSSGKICSAHGTCNELKAKCDCLKDWTGPRARKRFRAPLNASTEGAPTDVRVLRGVPRRKLLRQHLHWPGRKGMQWTWNLQEGPKD